MLYSVAMPAKRNIGIRLARARKAAKVSQRQLAGWLGIEHSIVTRLESGAIRLSAERAMVIARLLHVSVGELLGEPGAPGGGEPGGGRLSTACLASRPARARGGVGAGGE